MDVDSLPLCVFFTLACVVVGFALIKRSLAFHNLSITYALTNNSRDRVKVEAESAHAERLGTVLLFASWLPVTNAAWITDAKCDRLQQQMAAIEQIKSEPVSEPATQIAEFHVSHTSYQLPLSDGTLITVLRSEPSVSLPSFYRRSQSVNERRSTSSDGGIGRSPHADGSAMVGPLGLRGGAHDGSGAQWRAGNQEDEVTAFSREKEAKANQEKVYSDSHGDF